ncbi:MAG: phenylacetate--CoA ligase family protein [Candidatus Bathyarchaeia archaeon]
MVNFARLLYYLGCGLRRLYWDEQKLRRYQEKRLRAVVRYAYEHVPFYHQKFRKAGVKPDDIKCLEDLPKLPLVKKSELRQVPPRQRVSLEFDVDKLKVIRTSGSTGEPFTTYICGKEDDWRKAIYMRANISCGQKPRDRWVVITAPHHFHDTTDIQRKLGIYAQTCVSVFMPVHEQIEVVNKLKPDILDGYSGSLFLLAKMLDEKGLSNVRPRIVFGSADLIDMASRSFMERVYGAPYLDQYGCAEIDRSAWQCPEKVGYHMDVDSVITEFVDEDGKNVAVGEKGEIVFTSLFNYAMPLIRYAVGDIGVPSSDECPCGRNLPLMEVVEGRRDSFLVLPNGRLLSPMAIRNALANFFEYILQYRVIQKRTGLIEIYVKLRDAPIDKDRLLSDIVAYFSRTIHLEDDIEVNVKFVDDIPLSKTGKLMAVISEASK